MPHPTPKRWEAPKSPRDIPHLLPVEIRQVSHWNDPHELRVNNWIEAWDFSSELDVGIITVPSSKTSIKHNGASAAPNALREARYLHTTYTPTTKPKVAAVDFVEMDPYRDVAEITARTMNSAMLTFMAGLFLRQNDGWCGYDKTPIRDQPHESRPT